MSAAGDARHLSDIVRIVGGAPFDAHLAEILPERAERILAAEGVRDCESVLTDLEVELLLAGDEAKGAP